MRCLTVVLVSFFLGFYAAADDSLWDYHQRQLHEAVQTRDFYAAKVALTHLQTLDLDTFIEKRYALTQAWLARQEGYWETALTANQAALAERKPTMLDALEMAQSLTAMGRYREALDTLDQVRRYTGQTLWEVRALRAQSYLGLDQLDPAIDQLRRLTHRKAPGVLRDQANTQLLALYYQHNRATSARRLAESLTRSRPGSDAAYEAMRLQERYEPQTYLDREDVRRRFADVAYKNRDFPRADELYGSLIHSNTPALAQQARYLQALAHLKQGRSDEAVDAFAGILPQLKGGKYGGPAAFQYARALFMQGRDQETIDFTRRYWRESRDPKWRFEVLRLHILALRRGGADRDFLKFSDELERDKTPAWLWRFYHRNAVAWSMEHQQPERAMHHLDRYRRYRMKGHERQEARLWEGIIQWAKGDRQAALDRWLEVADRDPNHYFGLVARDFLHSHGVDVDYQPTAARNRREREQRRRADYHLAATSQGRDLAAQVLMDKLPDPAFLDAERLLARNPEARDLAAITRYDRAAATLKNNRADRLAYHYLQALWRRNAHDIHGSIRHGEILVNSYPKWAPYELIPDQVQELAFPTGFADIVQQRAQENAVDPFLLLAIIREESRFNHHAKSWASARGLMQFIPETAEAIAAEIDDLQDFSLPMLYQPETAIALGAKYVDNLMTNFDGVSLYTIAAYNAGEGAVDRWRGIGSEDPLRFVWDVTYSETKYYCQKVLRAYHHYTRIHSDEETRVIQMSTLPVTETRQLTSPAR